MIGALLFGLLIAGGVLVVFLAAWRFLSTQDPMDERLKQYGATEELSAPDMGADAAQLTGLNQTLNRLSLGGRLAAQLARTDVPMTVAEFSLLMMGLGVVGFLIGMLKFGPLFGIPIGGVVAYLPLVYLRYQAGNRRTKFASQLPDVLALLVGALRTGYGLLQGIEMLVTQMPQPAAAELSRVVRAVGLGMPMQRALSEMSKRMENDDFDLVVTAISVQYELGGNLAQTLETISDTIRDRVRIKREIQSLTSQQRMTAYILAGMPVVTAIVIYMLNPGYMGRLFDPGWIRLIPISALFMEFIGFMIMQKIIAIEV